MYKDLLSQEGYEVATALSVVEGAGTLRAYFPDLILLDMDQTPAQDAESARILVESMNGHRIPIVMITLLGDTSPDPRLPTEVRRCIYKPCRPRTLLEGVSDVLLFQH